MISLYSIDLSSLGELALPAQLFQNGCLAPPDRMSIVPADGLQAPEWAKSSARLIEAILRMC
ncbi:MAG: hypothetical protein MRK01_03225 [Candidatus Scalindua sp.]|nr:hypothetical protein [Candidatus Scalindua sp.]